MSARSDLEAPAAPGRAGRRGVGAGWIILLLLSLGVGLYGLSYLAGRPAPPRIAQNHAGMGWILAHATAAGLALMLGPWQFLAGVRAARPWLHRWIGRGYLAVCLAGGVTGLVLGLNTAMGPIAQSGFTSLAVAWLAVNALGYAAALRGDFARHRRWMIRSFALTFAAVTLRLYLPLTFLPGVSFAAGYPVIAWACWVPNLIAAEAWLRTRPNPPISRRV